MLLHARKQQKFAERFCRTYRVKMAKSIYFIPKRDIFFFQNHKSEVKCELKARCPHVFGLLDFIQPIHRKC